MKGFMMPGRVGSLLLICLVVIACYPLPALSTEKAASIQHVFLVSVDGLNYESYAAYAKSNAKYLAIEGVSAPRSLAIRADTVEAGEATLLTGCLPDQHRYFTRHDKVETESLLDVFVKKKLGILVVDGSGGKLKGFCRGSKEYVEVAANEPDSRVMERALAVFKQENPFFTYIYLDDCREALLQPTREAYNEALKQSDIEIGRLIGSLKEWGIYDQSVIIITAARSSSDDDLVPVVLKAPGIKPYTAVEGVTVFDVAPTICSLAGLSPPYACAGLTIWNAFLTQNEKQEKEFMERRLQELEKERIKNWTRYYELDKE